MNIAKKISAANKLTPINKYKMFIGSSIMDTSMDSNQPGIGIQGTSQTIFIIFEYGIYPDFFKIVLILSCKFDL